MKKLLFILLIFLLTMIQSCGSGESESTYDIYRVEVNTFLNIRATPSTKGKVLGRVDNGALVEVIEIKDGWAKVRYGGSKEAYMSSEYLSLVKKHKTEDAKADNNEVATEGTSPEAENMANATADDTGSESTPVNDISPDTIPKPSLIETVTFEAGRNVHFIGDTALLTSLDRSLISDNLTKSRDYIFIINTVPSVPTDELLDYAPTLYDRLTEEMNDAMSSGTEVLSWFGGDSPSSNVVLISYVRDSGLLQAECSGNSLRYLKSVTPEKYFKLQLDAPDKTVEAICAMAMATVEAGKKYDSQNWFEKSQVQAGYLSDRVFYNLFVRDILPRDTFIHNWVFGWAFALPLKLTNFVLECTSSVPMTLLILSIFNLLIYWSSIAGIQKDREYEEGCVAQIAHIVNIFMWMSILCLLIYLFPDMCNIAVMRESGFSNDLLAIAKAEYMTPGISKNILLLMIFLIGVFLATGLNPNFALKSTLSASKQKAMFESDNLKVISSLNKNVLKKSDSKKILDSKTPYTELLLKSFLNIGVIRTFYLCVPIAYVSSGTVLLYASIYAWTMAMIKILTVLAGAITYFKKGLYK